MPGMDQGDTGQIGKAHADIAGIGIVTMDDPGPLTLVVQEGGEVVDEAVEMIPKLLFRDVAFRSGVDPDDARLLAQGFDAARHSQG